MYRAQRVRQQNRLQAIKIPEFLPLGRSVEEDIGGSHEIGVLEPLKRVVVGLSVSLHIAFAAIFSGARVGSVGAKGSATEDPGETDPSVPAAKHEFSVLSSSEQRKWT